MNTRTNADKTKTQLIAVFARMAETTDAALHNVKKAGVPDVDSGSEIAAGFVNTFADARDRFRRGKNEVATLPTDDVAAFYAGVAAINQRMNSASDKPDPFTNIRSAELDAAFDESHACSSTR